MAMVVGRRYSNYRNASVSRHDFQVVPQTNALGSIFHRTLNASKALTRDDLESYGGSSLATGGVFER